MGCPYSTPYGLVASFGRIVVSEKSFRYRAGLQNVSLWNIAKLAHAFHVPISELFTMRKPRSKAKR